MGNGRKWRVTACLGLMVLAAAGVAQAHARLVSSLPGAGTTVGPPALLRLQFSESLAGKFSSLRLTAADGRPVTLVIRDVGDPKALAAAPANPLTPGLYQVSWVAVADDDGHKTSGSFRFSVK